ncbi:Methionine aminopeptidase 2 [Mycena indigotica]|uniref:Methionine aminopeptidase 2 n=1 Tax=Mycena indigotica TaxID=2126181 RepID=A0A8H6SYX2_9AGAR|nr:Methionine aminopeptidase 2 [Mycena indigotica]KAF7307196.1 Methionine aminopeptidase 2 [Mycena indigotica]
MCQSSRHRLRTLHDGILVGIETAHNDDPQLNTRHLPPSQEEPHHSPRPIILDGRLRLPTTCKLLKNHAAGTGRRPWIIAIEPPEDDASWQARFDALTLAGAKILFINRGSDRTDAALSVLHSQGIQSLMVEGGARVIESFLASHCVDTLLITTAPVLVGEGGIGYSVPRGNNGFKQNRRNAIAQTPPVQEPELDVVDNDDGEIEDEAPGVEGTEAAKKKKKKKKPKKKSAKPVQSDPPRIGLSQFFPDGIYPEGEIQHYKDDNLWRETSEEKRYLDKMTHEDPETTYQNIRKGAEVHRLVRQHARKNIRPGMSLTEIAENIEAGTRALVEGDGLEAGVGFPTGLNLNNCAAHFTPNAGDTTILQMGDILKVDIGVHSKGFILDSAFTMSWAPEYDQLIEAVKAATNTGIREAGIDVRLGELGGLIQETMESYEVEIGGKVYPVKSIENLSGHTIKPYQIHGGSNGKSVPLVKTNDQTKMEEGDYFAIETFGSTGRGKIVESGDCSHYAKIYDAPNVPLRLTSAKSLLKTINKNFGTLPFCRRYLDRLGESKYLLALNHLVAQGIVSDYPPLFDQIGSKTAQFEHTIILRPTCKEVVSRGDDY